MGSLETGRQRYLERHPEPAVQPDDQQPDDQLADDDHDDHDDDDQPASGSRGMRAGKELFRERRNTAGRQS